MRVPIGLSAALALSLATPALADAPDDLPGQVAGVIGSGAALTLKFRPVAGQPTRILSQGDVYADDWVLTALTPSIATLTKAGQSRTVGLNPTGAVEPTAPPAPPSEIKVTLSTADLAYLDASLASGFWDGKPNPGLTLDETRRRLLYDKKIREARPGSPDGLKALLGADYVDYLGLALAQEIAMRQLALDKGYINAVRRVDGLPPIGPDKIVVPAGTAPSDAFLAAGLVGEDGYSYDRPDANGDRTYVRSTVKPPGMIPTLQAQLQAAAGAPPTNAQK